MSRVVRGGGRRRSPIWEHFELNHNVAGKRLAECKFCARAMKPQPDRMENHFIKLCRQVDSETRRNWLLAREANASESLAATTQEHEHVDLNAIAAAASVGGQHDAQQHQQTSTIRVGSSIGPFPGSGLTSSDAPALPHVSANGVRRPPLPKIAPAVSTTSEPATVGSTTTLSSAPVLPAAINTIRKSPPTNSSNSATKRAKQTRTAVPDEPTAESAPLPSQQQQLPTRNTGSRPEQQRSAANKPSTSLLSPQSQSLVASTTSHWPPAFTDCELRKRELDAQKAQLEIESLRFDNDMKRIRVAEENMLARKRLQDAGVPQADIDLLLPLQHRGATR